MNVINTDPLRIDQDNNTSISRSDIFLDAASRGCNNRKQTESMTFFSGRTGTKFSPRAITEKILGFLWLSVQH